MPAPPLPRLTRLRLRLGDFLNNLDLFFSNFFKRRFRKQLGYFVLTLKGNPSEYAPPAPRWRRFLPLLGLPGRGGDGLSINGLRRALERIAADPRPQGIVVRLDDLDPGWGTAQTIRGLLLNFRQSGKRVIAHSAYSFNTRTYFVATAADEIYGPPSTSWEVLGLRAEFFYLKDALEPWGLRANVIAISPYKTAGDPLVRAGMSPEEREIRTRLLDGIFATLIEAIATGRNLPEARVKTLIDQAPFSLEEAKKAGLVDDTLYLDELPARLAAPRPPDPPPGGEASPVPDNTHTLTNLLIPEEKGPRLLLRPVRKRSGYVIGLISLVGTIVPGESRDMPIPLPFPIPIVGDDQAGSETLAEAFRAAEDNPRIAAIVFHVNSPGGSSIASDLIWREMDRVRRKKPVVVYFGNVAASGGYYVAATADWIVAQPLTVTGSIGVLMVKILTEGLLSMFGVHRETLQRGAHAGLYADDVPLEGELYDVARQEIVWVYEQFKSRVFAGRKMPPEALEQIAGGRVWLGEHALANGLVDELGDLHTAYEKAKQLAQIPPDLYTPIVWVDGSKSPALPPPFPTEPPATWLKHWTRYFNEKTWMISPFEIRIK